MGQANTHVHPVFQGALNAMVGLDTFVRDAELDAYKDALRRMDWQFEFSGDHNVYRRGGEQLTQLHRMQLNLDASGAIWREYMPQGHAVPGPLKPGVNLFTVTAYAGDEPQFAHTEAYPSLLDAAQDGASRYDDMVIDVREVA